MGTFCVCRSDRVIRAGSIRVEYWNRTGGLVSEDRKTPGGYRGHGVWAQGGRIACSLLWVGLFLTSGSAATAQQSASTAEQPAYYAGKMVRFTPAGARRGKTLAVGNMRLGSILNRTPDDHRLNAYLVCPGTDPQPGKDGVSCSLVLNSLPRTDEPVEWDVYWVVILDPALTPSFTGEKELLVTAQQAFTPGGEFEFADLPGAAVLRKYLHIHSLEGLASFELDQGDLPKVIIVPSRFAIRASAVDPDAQSPSSSVLTESAPHRAGASGGNAR
jgi:hypothetical protein